MLNFIRIILVLGFFVLAGMAINAYQKEQYLFASLFGIPIIFMIAPYAFLLIFYCYILLFPLIRKRQKHISNKFLSALEAGESDTVKKFANKIDARHLLENGDESYLTVAIKKMDLQASVTLIENGADVDFMPRYWSQTPLMLAAGRGDEFLEVTKRLLSAGADVNKVPTQGEMKNMRPIDIAIKEKASNTVELLMKHGASLDRGDEGIRP